MQPTTDCFDLDGVRYRYLCMKSESVRGRRRAPVILVHGFAQSSSSWFDVSERLAEERDVYAIDLVGHGGSAVPASAAPYSLRAMADALLNLVELVPGKPVIAGYSMGGRVALNALLEVGPAAFAKKTRGLLLESAGFGPKTEGERAIATERDAATVRRLRETSIDEFMEYWESLPLFASQRSLPKRTRAMIRADRLANDSEALARCVECAGQHRMPSFFETTSALRELGLRGYSTLYVTGEKDQKYARIARDLHAAGVVQTRVAPKAGHNVHLEDPATFVACVHSVA